MDGLTFQMNQSSAQQVFRHLSFCDEDFIPPLSSRLNLRLYSQKLALNALRFESWHGEFLVGLVAVYHNAQSTDAFITSVSVERHFRHDGIAKKLLGLALAHGDERSILRSHLEVNEKAEAASRLYRSFGFRQTNDDTTPLKMIRPLPINR